MILRQTHAERCLADAAVSTRGACGHRDARHPCTGSTSAGARGLKPGRFLRTAPVLATALLIGIAPALANDWLHWRGPEQTGATREPAAVTTWGLDGTNVLWKNDIGGRTTPIVAGGRVYLICPVGEGITLGERIVCLDASTGKPVWEQRFAVYHTDIVENRVGWTAVAVDPETGNVYAHGTGGDLLCFDRDGKPVWKRSLSEEFGRFSGYGGRLYTPIVNEGRVIIGFLSTTWSDKAPMVHVYCAFDKRDGTLLWGVTPGERPMDTTYATPVVAVIGGRRLLICPHSDGWIYALHARSGQTVWKYHLAARPVNPSPVVDGNRVYVCHSEENPNTTVMGAIACINGEGTGDVTASGQVWRRDGIDAGYASPALANGRLYVVDNSAQVHCLDAASGETLWSFNAGRIGRGSPVATADGVLYVVEQNGNFWTLRDKGESAELLGRVEFPTVNQAVQELQGSPSVAGGRVYFQTRYATYCLGKPDATVDAPVPAMAKDTVPGGDPPPLPPTAPRVRGTATLPIEETFESLSAGSTPPGWLNTVQRTAIVERDGSKCLKTLSERPSPIFMRLRMFFAPPIAGGYTIEADVLSSSLQKAGMELRADCGVINSRYDLRLLGTEPTLRIVSWDSIPRLQKDVPFEWKADTWYRLKLQVRFDGGKGRIRGKVWPREAQEPTAWTIEIEDPFPTLEGAPGLYAYCAGTTERKKGAEAFFDNVKVSGNE